MRVLLDENLPHDLKPLLMGHEISTVQEAGWAGTKNGDLLKLAESRFEVFLTADKNLRYQQNLSVRKFAVIELPTNRWPILRILAAQITTAIASAKPSSYLIIES